METKQKETQMKPTENVTYTLDEFRTAAKKLFGYGPEVVDGAVYDRKQETYTVEEMKKLVADFLKKPVRATKEGE